jgi:hypothetical protein
MSTNNQQPQDSNNQPTKGKSFKNIADLLKMDGSDGFDEAAAEKELMEMEARKKQIEDFKRRFAEIQSMTNVDEYMSNILKELVGKGMVMLDSLQHEIEDNPTGRDVETAAAMITSINSIIDNINNIKVSQAKLGLEQQKIDVKKQSAGAPQGTVTNNVMMFGTTSDLMDLLITKKVIPDGNAPAAIEPPIENKTITIEGNTDANQI